MALARAASVASGIAHPIGIFGVFSPRRYWISRLLAALPGVIAGPCLPPFRTLAKSATESELAGVEPPWQDAQLACNDGRILSRKMDSLESAAGRRLALSRGTTTYRRPTMIDSLHDWAAALTSWSSNHPGGGTFWSANTSPG